MDNHGNREIAIQVRNMSKNFRVYFDKGHMLKEKLLFTSRNRYETREILKDVSFDIYKGEAVGLIGHNGCGKSTALKLLTRIIYPDSGSVTVKGRVSSLLELGAGFHPDLSGIENIYINASIFGLKRKEIDAKLEEIIAFSELGDYINNPVRTYSSGMYMRLAFSVAINVEADILLVDEILAVGDAGFQAKCLNKINEIKNNGTTIVIVSHSMNQIQDVCDRCIWINDGHVAAIGETSDVIGQYMHFVEESEKKKIINNTSNQKEVVKEDNAAFHAIDLQILDSNGVDKRIWGIGESLKILLHFSASQEVNAKVRFEIVRADGIMAYANVYGDSDNEYQLKQDNMLEFYIPQVNLLAGKFLLSVYFETEKGELLGGLVPFAEIDIVDASARYGVANLECGCEFK